MTTLKGDAAKKFTAEIHERNQRIKQERLTKAKEDAAASGKEAFDLAKLETLCDTSIDGFLAPLEDRRRDLEYRYYVNEPAIRTIEEFAAFITRTNTY